jgi:hypothetical protein
MRLFLCSFVSGCVAFQLAYKFEFGFFIAGLLGALAGMVCLLIIHVAGV